MINKFGKKQVYPFMAIIFSLLDIINMAQAGEYSLAYLLLHCITFIAVASMPWSPHFGGLFAVLSCLGLLLFPYMHVGGSIMSGLAIIVVADAIARGWWPQSVAYVLMMVGGYVYSPQYNSSIESLLSLAFFLFMSSVIGFLMYAYQKQITAVDLMHEKRLGELRLGVARRLHDAVATDLTKALLASRLLQSDGDSQLVVNNLQIIESSLKKALNELRSVATVLAYDSEADSITVKQLLQEERKLMLLSDQQLVTHGNFDDDEIQSALGPLSYRLFIKFMREGLVNCHKYAAHNSTIRAWTSVDGGLFQAVLVSQIGADRKGATTPELSSGMGLDNLVREARVHGGAVNILSRDDQWVLMLELPLKGFTDKDSNRP